MSVSNRREAMTSNGERRLTANNRLGDSALLVIYESILLSGCFLINAKDEKLQGRYFETTSVSKSIEVS